MWLSQKGTWKRGKCCHAASYNTCTSMLRDRKLGQNKGHGKWVVDRLIFAFQS